MLLTSQSWLHPSDFNSDIVTMTPSNKRVDNKAPTTININTCRPMSYQEDGAKVIIVVRVLYLCCYSYTVTLATDFLTILIEQPLSYWLL